MPASDAVVRTLLELSATLRASTDGTAGPAYQPFEQYLARNTLDGLQRQMRYTKRILEPLGEIPSSRLLEVGSGYGTNLLVLSAMGFTAVHGIEIVPSIHASSLRILEAARAKLGLSESSCTAFLGDAEATGLPEASYDLILANEAISHFPSLDRFLREANRLLVSGGTLVIADGNNLSCPYYRRTRMQKWAEVRELELRKRVLTLRERFRHISPQEIASIALHTELLPLDEVERLVPEIVDRSRLPMSLYFEGHPPVYSDTGVWDEKGFHPRRFVRELRGYGFDSRARIYAGSAHSSFLRAAEEILNLLPSRLRFLWRPSFFCYARKVSAPTYLVDDVGSDATGGARGG